MSQDMYDHLPALEAALQAWAEPGPSPGFHEDMKRNVRLAMPLLARALDRAAQEQERKQ